MLRTLSAAATMVAFCLIALVLAGCAGGGPSPNVGPQCRIEMSIWASTDHVWRVPSHGPYTLPATAITVPTCFSVYLVESEAPAPQGGVDAVLAFEKVDEGPGHASHPYSPKGNERSGWVFDQAGTFTVTAWNVTHTHILASMSFIVLDGWG